MKKVVLTTIAAAFAVSVFAQGTMTFNNRVVGSVDAKIYLGAPGEAFKTGNTATGFPVGSQTYLGAALGGAGYTAQIWGGPVGTPENALTLAGGYSTATFRTGAAAGYVATSTASTIINGVAEGSSALIALRVWDNAGGSITTWDAAKAAGVAVGELLFNSPALGGFAPAPNMVGLQSFNIVAVPEPATFALAGLGAAAMLIFRRRK